MRIIDLINICSFKKIAQKIVLHYGSCDLIKYKELYEKLKEMELPVSKDFCIYISAYQEKNDDYILVHDFNEDDTNLFFDVSGYKSKDSIVYSIAAASFTEFLQFQIDEDTLSKYSNETILAHCFYEITYYGFDDLDRKL